MSTAQGEGPRAQPSRLPRPPPGRRSTRHRPALTDHQAARPTRRTTTSSHRNQSALQRPERTDRARDTGPDWSTGRRNQCPERREVTGQNQSPGAARSSVTPAMSRNYPAQAARAAGTGDQAGGSDGQG
ncbi:hypothetical protein KCMC57_up14450 [Kitasatospora sp. CMC57]|uniref:Uncharacterized protein n=1 Tax=Kitasatospora sp. CMC57 TaxID=3231513 RepID=A0AB33JUG4_9ACTN